MSITSFKDLVVWQKSMELVTEIYKLTAQLPEHEKFGLKSQLQRCAVSIPSNIAEGSKRGSRADFRQFCIIALGSAAELETQLLIVGNLYSQTLINPLLPQVVEVEKMLTSLVKSLKTSR